MKIFSYILSLPIRVLITGIFILAIVAIGLVWGVGRALNSPDEQSPATTVEPTAPLTAPPAAATTQGTSPQGVATLASTPLSPAGALTSAPLLPSPTPAPLATLPATAGEWESVQSGEGLYMVCRRHCPARWPPDDDALATYAEAVAELNGLAWPPDLSVGQRVRMPPCPAR